MKKVALAAAAVLAVGVPAGAMAGSSGSSEMGATKTIVGVASDDARFSTLVSLVKQAGLVKTLSGNAKYTVLAPTNAAFKRVPKATLDALGKDKAELRRVLTYHVLKGAVPSTTVVTLRSAKTVEGSNIRIKVAGGKVKINNSATVIVTDVPASNGVIHAIDRVLLPPAK
jgi:uncharacterized surface protein with fasciclin (FAS1) repeats